MNYCNDIKSNTSFYLFGRFVVSGSRCKTPSVSSLKHRTTMVVGGLSRFGLRHAVAGTCVAFGVDQVEKQKIVLDHEAGDGAADEVDEDGTLIQMTLGSETTGDTVAFHLTGVIYYYLYPYCHE